MKNDSRNLLIVDDQPDNLRVLASILSKQGYRVRKALSGAIAVETAKLQPPDLILLDIMMPGMDGYEVCSVLKGFSQTSEIPVIFLSGIDSASDKVKAFALGGADYITKPFQAEEVLVRVRQQLTLQWQTQQLQQEIQDRKQAQAETQLLLAIVQAVSEAKDFETALDAVLSNMRRAIAWNYSEVWTPNQNTSVFQLNQTCYDADDQQLCQFHADSQVIRFSRNVGLLGRVWESRQAEWIEDLSQAPESVFLRSLAAHAAELKSAFAVPIVLDEQVLAVLVFFQRSRSEYDPNLIRLVNAIAFQLGGFIQHKQAEAALKQANLELHRLANSDGLTQIANRRYFDERLQQEWRRLKREQQPLSLILCDVDLFKRYNDFYGYLAGDDCLRQVAQAIAQCIKRPADLTARYGGEEFAVILPNTNREGVIRVAAQIQAAIAALHLPHSGSAVSKIVTLSMGIASSIPQVDDPESLIAIADKALYAAKANGRNQYV